MHLSPETSLCMPAKNERKNSTKLTECQHITKRSQQKSNLMSLS